jgi:hypothetical protein
VVRGNNDSLIAFSRPLRVKLANVGDIIPPCGVPRSVSVNTPLSIAPLLSHALIIGLYRGFMYKLFSSQS